VARPFHIDRDLVTGLARSSIQRLLVDPNKTSPRLHINIAIFILALLAIVGGLRTVGEEHKRTPESLQSRYQELNRKFFDNSLPPVRIEWADLTGYNREGETYREDDGTFVVLVDLRTNLRDEDLQDTVSHEMCHVATWRREDDPHGPSFRACMEAIKGKPLQDGRMKAR
jgi:hypothetical protein